jgi:signal transduction histidine kinase/ligand-binding sensor domain-containing protein/DNA-binding response OmpR family regulator
MNMKKLLHLIVYMIPAISAGQLQNVYFKNYSVQDGLSHTKVNSICQDKYGFMWFATESGLNKFDGCNFIKYYASHDSQNSLSGNNIEVIINDGFGNLLIGTNNGLDIFNYETETFERFWLKAHDTLRYTSHSVTAITVDNNARLWVGTTNGLILFERADLSEPIITDPDSHIFRYVYSRKIEGLSDNYIHCIESDRMGNIWVGTVNGLNLISPISEEVRQFFNNPDDPLTLSNNDINHIFQSSDNFIWISTQRGGLNRLTEDGTAQIYFTRFLTNPDDEHSISNNTVRDIIEMGNGYLWIGTFNGLNIFDIKNEKFHRYFPDPLKQNSLSFKSVTSLYKDKSGSVWLGTYYGGIDYYDPRLNYFDSYRNNNYDSTSVSFNVISSMVEDNRGVIWVGTEGGGLNWFNKEEGNFKRIRTLYNKDVDFSDMIITSLLEDAEGVLWVGTHRHGLHIIDQRTESQYELILPEQRPFVSNRINISYALFQDSEGKIWIGTHGKGIFVYEKGDGNFHYYLNDQYDKNSISSNIINAFLEDKEGDLLVATDIGLSIFDEKTDGFVQVNIHNSDSLEKNISVISLYQDLRGNVWAGSSGGGLFILNKEKMEMVPVTRDELLDAKVIFGIEEDSNGTLWLSTNQGIYQCDPSGFIRKFDIHDGIQSNQFSRNSILKCRDGDILFGGINGLNRLKPGKVGMNQFPPEIILTDLFVNNRLVKFNDKGSPLTAPLNEISEIKFNHKQNDFGFQFVALNYILPEKNRYKYMLKGFDNEWIETGSENRRINYSNLRPGDYTFMVLASNNDGVWTPSPKTIAIHLQRAPWESWWAISFYAITIALLLLLFLNLFTRKRKIQHQLELERYEKDKINEINQMKLQFFTNISHEIRTPLTMILSPLEKILKENPGIGFQKQLLFIQKSANKLFDLVNQLLDFRKVESNKMDLHPDYFDLSESIDLISEHYDEYCRNEGIQFISDLDHSPVLAYMDRQKFEKIIWNLLSNAVKFTNSGGKIWLKSRIRNNRIIISVRDNGRGIPKQEQQKIFERFYQADSEGAIVTGTGIGLFLARSYAEMFGGTISVESEAGKGSLFTVELPVGLPEKIQPTETGSITVYDEKKIPQGQKDLPFKQWTSHSSEMKLPLMLIVEDEKDIRDYLCEIFDEQFRVICSPDGLAGYKLALQRLPGIILSDYKMPAMDGIEFCKRIKSDIKTSHIPFILLSAYNTVENKIEGLQTGADDYIDKPFQVDILKLKVNNILKTRMEIIQKFKRQFLLDPNEISRSAIDKAFLEKAEKKVLDNYSSPEFSPEVLCRELNISRTTLHVKLKALINQSASEFIKTIRVKEAINLMKENKYRISEIAYMTGFNSAHYFTYSFKQVTKLTPTEFMEKGDFPPAL